MARKRRCTDHEDRNQRMKQTRRNTLTNSKYEQCVLTWSVVPADPLAPYLPPSTPVVDAVPSPPPDAADSPAASSSSRHLNGVAETKKERRRSSIRWDRRISVTHFHKRRAPIEVASTPIEIAPAKEEAVTDFVESDSGIEDDENVGSFALDAPAGFSIASDPADSSNSPDDGPPFMADNQTGVDDRIETTNIDIKGKGKGKKSILKQPTSSEVPASKPSSPAVDTSKETVVIALRSKSEDQKPSEELVLAAAFSKSGPLTRLQRVRDNIV